MLLTGHEGPIYSLSFDPKGENLASASMDGKIYLWEVYGGCSNYNILAGHKNAVLDVHWATPSSIVSCSADKTVALWDANKGYRTRKFADHTSIVNSCSAARDTPNAMISGSDDYSAIIWDARSKYGAQTLYHDYPVLATCIAHDGTSAYTGGIDNIIRRYDLRKSDEAVEDMSLKGLTDSITGLALSADGARLLSNAMDSSLCSWDVRPFVVDENNRCERVFEGVHHGAEKNLLKCSWSPDGEKVACGSADRVVKIWDATSSKLLYYLPGHKGSVNDVIFHPLEPIVASCGTDKQIYLGELS
jgi:Prp8 binding protein